MNDGDAVLTYKRRGNWYLRGVGGQPYFGREGLTWALIADTLDVRYLPAGYILDSGAPCAFVRQGVSPDELYFVMGWTLTRACSQILKQVINHTRNIQSKDFERLPYPYWAANVRERVIESVKALIACARGQGRLFTRESVEIRELDRLFEPPWLERD